MLAVANLSLVVTQDDMSSASHLRALSISDLLWCMMLNSIPMMFMILDLCGSMDTPPHPP